VTPFWRVLRNIPAIVFLSINRISIRGRWIMNVLNGLPFFPFFWDDDRQMDRRFTIAVVFALLATCGQTLVAQMRGWTPDIRSLPPVNRAPSPPQLIRLPHLASEMELARLPSDHPANAFRLLASAANSDRETSRQSTRRRYPSTERIVTHARKVTPPITYRWDPNDASLAATASSTEKRIKSGFKLANKGALYGARAEFRKAILAVAEALDARYGSTGHSQAFQEPTNRRSTNRRFASDGGQAS
jgi:hypothetical protein